MLGQRDIGGYIRVSTSQQGDSGLSLDRQLERIRGLVTARQLPGRLLTFRDVASAGDYERPGLSALLDRIADGSVGTVIITGIDRLVRRMRDYVRITEHLERHHCLIASCDGNIDLTTPHGRLSSGILALVAEFERELAAGRTREAMAELKSQGRIAGNAPYGYRAAGDGFLEPDEGEQAALEVMRSAWHSGHSLTQISRMLAAGGHLNRAGRPHSKQSVSRLLRDHPEE